jgi:hypothetical protein
MQLSDHFELMTLPTALYDQRMARGLLVFQRLQAINAKERESTAMEGIEVGEATAVDPVNNRVDSDSELSTVSSSRFLDLEEY